VVEQVLPNCWNSNPARCKLIAGMDVLPQLFSPPYGRESDADLSCDLLRRHWRRIYWRQVCAGRGRRGQQTFSPSGTALHERTASKPSWWRQSEPPRSPSRPPDPRSCQQRNQSRSLNRKTHKFEEQPSFKKIAAQMGSNQHKANQISF